MTKAEKDREYYLAHREAIKARVAARYREKRGEVAAYYRQWAVTHRDTVRRHQRAYENRARADGREAALQRSFSARLTDGYVRSLIALRCGVPAKAIPRALVEAKRQQLRALRAIKEKQK